MQIKVHGSAALFVKPPGGVLSNGAADFVVLWICCVCSEGAVCSGDAPCVTGTVPETKNILY